MNEDINESVPSRFVIVDEIFRDTQQNIITYL